jgi:hypothetical protein
VGAAAIPGRDDAEKARLLHTVIVGGGPTGVEFAGEVRERTVISCYIFFVVCQHTFLFFFFLQRCCNRALCTSNVISFSLFPVSLQLVDFIRQDLSKVRPELARDMKVTLIEAHEILGSFDESLREVRLFQRCF